MSSSSATSRIAFRNVMVVLLLLLLFYIGRPLYWKISSTIHGIRHNKQTVTQSLTHTQIVMEAQKSVGWYHNDSSGVRATTRKLFRYHVLWRVVG